MLYPSIKYKTITLYSLFKEQREHYVFLLLQILFLFLISPAFQFMPTQNLLLQLFCAALISLNTTCRQLFFLSISISFLILKRFCRYGSVILFLRICFPLATVTATRPNTYYHLTREEEEVQFLHVGSRKCYFSEE